MSIRIACPSCRGTLTVADDMAGQRLRCPTCDVVLQIPSRVAPRVADDRYMERERPRPAQRDVDIRRRPTERKEASSAAFWWSIAGASTFGVLLLVVILVIVLNGGDGD